MWMIWLTASALAGPAEPAPIDVNGTWVPIGDHEVGPKAIPVNSCLGHRTTWALVARGPKVTATLQPAQHTSGALRVDVYRTSATLEGQWKTGTLALSGKQYTLHTMRGRPSFKERTAKPLNIVLTVEPKTGHLVGTNGNKPIRLAPGDMTPIDRSKCGPPPP